MIVNQSCVNTNILSFEDDDVYFTKKDIVSEKEMQEYLDSKKKKENQIIEEETEVEEYEF